MYLQMYTYSLAASYVVDTSGSKHILHRLFRVNHKTPVMPQTFTCPALLAATGMPEAGYVNAAALQLGIRPQLM